MKFEGKKQQNLPLKWTN